MYPERTPATRCWAVARYTSPCRQTKAHHPGDSPTGSGCLAVWRELRPLCPLGGDRDLGGEGGLDTVWPLGGVGPTQGHGPVSASPCSLTCAPPRRQGETRPAPQGGCEGYRRRACVTLPPRGPRRARKNTKGWKVATGAGTLRGARGPLLMGESQGLGVKLPPAELNRGSSR